MKKIILAILILMISIPVMGNAQESSPPSSNQTNFDHPLPVRHHKVKTPKRAKRKIHRRAPKARRPGRRARR